MKPRTRLDRVRASLAGLPEATSSAAVGVAAAAVAAVLREPAGVTEILLIRRAARQGDPWSGQMGLPGGHREPADASLLDTAIRETREEVGLDLRAHAVLLGELPTVDARARGMKLEMTVTPFVFELQQDAPAHAGSEVDEVVWTQLEPLAAGERNTTYPLELAGGIEHRPAWDVDGRIVWGLTHQMLSSLFDTLARGPTTP